MKYRKLDADGDYQFGNGAEFLKDSPLTVAQAIYTRLLLHTGEWFLDSTEGTPYVEQIEGFGTQATRDPAIQARIVGTLGVEELLSYSSALSADRRFTVNARIETLFGQVQAAFAMPTTVTAPPPTPVPPPPPPCDCSHVAWVQNPDGLIITDDELPALRGTMLVSARPDLVIISTVDPLYGISSVQVLGGSSAPAITLIDPALPIVDAWTINFSVKATDGANLVLGTWSTPTPGDPFGSLIRVELQSDGVGGARFFFFDSTTFNSGTEGGFSYSTTFNCEFSVGDGHFFFFVNGAIVFSQSSSASTFVRAAFQDLGTMQLDEIRVTNRVEHTEPYVIDLPFCTCPV